MSVPTHLPFPVKLNLAAPPTASRPGYDTPPAAASGCAAITDSEATTRIDSNWPPPAPAPASRGRDKAGAESYVPPRTDSDGPATALLAHTGTARGPVWGARVRVTARPIYVRRAECALGCGQGIGKHIVCDE
jgi:hypothetical protein